MAAIPPPPAGFTIVAPAGGPPPPPAGFTIVAPAGGPPPPPAGFTMDGGSSNNPGPNPPPSQPSYSLPTSWEDAFHRIMGKGLLQTPAPQPAPGQPGITPPSQALGSGDVLPNPAMGVTLGAALTGGGMAADTAAHGGSAADIVQNGLIGAGSAVAGGALGAISEGIGAAGKAAGSDVMRAVASRAPALTTLAKSAVGAAREAVPGMAGEAAAVLKAAAQQGPQRLATAHYILSQQDPAYAAQQQKKGGK